MRYFIIIAFLLSGCSHNHINIENYKKTIKLKKSPNSPSREELNSKSMRIVVLNLDHQINSFAKEANIGFSIAKELSNELSLHKRIEVLKRLKKPTFIKELKKYEYAKKFGVNLENSDYLLTGEITQADHKKRYHPSKERNQGGTSSAWTSYLACAKGSVQLFKLPSMTIQETFPFDECIHDSSIEGSSLNGVNEKLSELLTRTAPLIVESIMPKIFKAFKPRGYIESMRINGDKKIIKTTLNRRFGAIEGRKVEIVKREKEKNLRGGEDIIEIPIGSGTISDLITDSYSFIIVDELKGEVHQGDVVRVVD